jgi:hypothetical protein
MQRPKRNEKSVRTMTDIVRSEATNVGALHASIRLRRLGFGGFLLDAGALLLWAAGCAIPFYFKRSQLLVGFDGGYMRDIAQRQFDWHIPAFSTSLDFFQGQGDVFFPVNFTLFPAFIAASRFGNEFTAPIIIYVIVLAEISLAILFFARCLGASRVVSVGAAVVTGVTMFPFGSPTLIYGILSLSPGAGSTIAAALVIGGAYVAFGRTGLATDIPLAAVILVLFLWSILASPTSCILSAPFFLLCCISGILAAAGTTERWCKTGLFLGVLVILVTTGPALYMAGLLVDTAAAAFPLELMNDRATFMFASILFHWNSNGPAGPILVCLAIAGALISVFDQRQRTIRMFAITLLTYLGSRLTFAALTILFDFWRGPSPLYFEFFVIPLYAIFATLFLARALAFVLSVLGRKSPRAGTLTLAVAAAGLTCATTMALVTEANDYGFHFPPKLTPFIELIAQQTSLVPGAQFRGRTANMVGRTIDRKLTWPDLHESDAALNREIGNEMRVVGLHTFGIPSLFEYVPTITPAYYAMTSRLLARPDDSQMRSVSVLRRINLRILAMFGVRFVITDAPMTGAVTLRATMPVQGAPLFLYEIQNPNFGDYSPTIVVQPTTATEAIRHLAKPDFDPSHQIIAAFTGDDEHLVPASNARITFEGASLRVQADSTGRSILLLPLEFSRCLQITASESGEPAIFRADLLETGVIFSKRLDMYLALRTSPFLLNPGCRLRDYFDVTSLEVGKVPISAGAAGSQD